MCLSWYYTALQKVLTVQMRVFNILDLRLSKQELFSPELLVAHTFTESVFNKKFINQGVRYRFVISIHLSVCDSIFFELKYFMM